MSSKKTTGPGYHLWEPPDEFLRKELNENNLNINHALANSLQITSGTYTGNGKSERTITLSFTPRMIIVTDYYCALNSKDHSSHYGGIASHFILSLWLTYAEHCKKWVSGVLRTIYFKPLNLLFN